MKTILVATDFSPSSLNAANYAAEMAFVIKADLLLFHAYQITDYYSEIPVALKVEDMQQENAERNILKLKKHLLKEINDKILISTVLRMGDFFHELKTICNEINPYIVIMGCQGTSAIERFIFGNHAVYAMKHLKWPLITVPLGVSFLSFKKIALVFDNFKAIDSTIVDEIKALKADLKAEIHILISNKEVFDQEIVFESGILHEIMASLKPHYHFILNNNKEETIIDYIENNHFDLMIILPKQHSLIEKLIHKSPTKFLVLHSHVPIMALHP